jgi:DNA-binding protein YbaB
MSDNVNRPDPAEAVAEFERLKAEAEATVRRFDEMAAEFGTDAVEVYSEDRLLRVTLDANGNVDRIGVEEAAMRSRQTLGRAMVLLIAEARAEHQRRTTEMARRMLGDRFDLDAIMARYTPKQGPQC